MNHEVYICYDEKDQLTADAICHVLEDNKIKCWLKTRDLGVNDLVDEILEAINQAQVMVLIFSSHSKNSNYVNTEVDIAFTEKMPILVFKIDESKLDGGLEFFLNNKHWLDAYPNPEVKFESLIRDTSKLLGKPISEPVVPKKTVKAPEKETEDEDLQRLIKAKDEKVKASSNSSFLSKYKIPIIALAVILIAGCGIFMFMSSGGINTGDVNTQIDGNTVNIKITDFHMDDVSKKGLAWKYSYYVGGTVSPMPTNGDGYLIVADFYNQNGKLINSTQTKLSEIQKINDGLLLGSTTADNKDIQRVEVNLVNENGIVFAQGESNL